MRNPLKHWWKMRKARVFPLRLTFTFPADAFETNIWASDKIEIHELETELLIFSPSRPIHLMPGDKLTIHGAVTALEAERNLDA